MYRFAVVIGGFQHSHLIASYVTTLISIFLEPFEQSFSVQFAKFLVIVNDLGG